MSHLIYVADDEKNTRDLIEAFLKRDGFSVTAFATGDALLNACEKNLPDLVILDILMPGTSGLSICSALRNIYQKLPIIISCKDSPYDRVTGLTLGCDDYMVKPFLPLELSARVRALLRRSTSVKAEESSREVLRYGPLTLSPIERSAKLNGDELHLTPTEFDFLEYLMQNAGAAVRREELLKALWGVDWQSETRVSDDHLKRLRKKLRERNSPVQIQTIWGYGFRLTGGDTE